MGGNSDAALKRAAKYADGWMPMAAPASVAKTARTPPVTTTEELRERLSALEAFAGDRYSELALILSFSGPRLSDFEKDAEQIRHRFGELEELGVDWTFVGPPWSPAPGPVEWIKAFGATFFPA
jgi:alkanesulfonate monooxygenase SsuD/methylene tetrahydromethanopterin reductase-like flavin-dependent oxidoreductase (luciferase family)